MESILIFYIYIFLKIYSGTNLKMKIRLKACKPFRPVFRQIPLFLTLYSSCKENKASSDNGSRPER